MQFGDKGGCGAAAAAHHRNTDGSVFFHFGGKAVRIQVVAAVRVGQTRIGFDKDRHTGGHAAAKPLSKGQNFLGAKRAVDAHGVRAEACRRDGVAFHCAAGEGTAPALEAHRGKDRQGAVFFGGQDGGFQLVQVGHRLQKDEVGTGCRACTDDLGELGIGILKAQGACGNQQLTQGADVQRHQCAGSIGGLAGAGDGCRDDILHRMAAACQFFCVGAKGVCQQDISPGVGIVGVDGRQYVRHFQRGQLGFLPGLQTACLQLGTHAAVQKNKPLAVKNFANLHKILPYPSWLKQVVPRLRNEQVSFKWQVAQPARVPVTG